MGDGRPWLALGALSGLCAVALSAFAAHAPWALDPARAPMLGNALAMQGWHALALLATGLLAERRPGRWAAAAGACFALGSLLFAGGVWWTAALGRPPLPVAPAGGVLLMLGWALLLPAALRR